MRKAIILAAAIAIAAGCAADKKILRKPFSKQIYIVKKGDTLGKIARKFKTSATAIKKANKLKLTKITPGQRLVIPRATKGTASKKKRSGKRKAALPPPKKAPSIKTKLAWPVSGTVTSKFGVRKSEKHDGIDIAAKKGTKIRAAADGTVMYSGWGPTGYGLIVVLRHSTKLITVYAHNSKNLAKKGNNVKKGDAIALVGHTGRASGNHVHFEVRINRSTYNPLKYLPKRK